MFGGIQPVPLSAADGGELPSRLDPYESALIGNCQSALLVARDATITWGCLPTFQSPSVFARLLDEDGGHFAIEPLNGAPVEQRYLPLTNIVVTRFEGPDAAWEVIDWMPRYFQYATVISPPVVHRLIRPLRGGPRVRVVVRPRPGFATLPVRVSHMGSMLLYDDGVEHFYLQSNLPLASIAAERPMTIYSDAGLTFSAGEPMPGHSLATVKDALEHTRRYWEGWSRHCYLPRDYQEPILRSALALKLLTFADTGAVIAAPTTSLPEVPGGERNWDYRYCWLRDSYFVVRALSRLAQFEEQDRYVGYLEQLALRSEQLQPVYGIAGEAQLIEFTLDHLSGAYGSRPVRVGNQAWEHQQNDVYGELMLTLTPVFFDARFVSRHGKDALWELIVHLASEVMRVWREPDQGIWEYRHKHQHYVFSKLMCWVALDRAAQIAKVRGEDALRRLWRREAATIRADVLTNGWSERLQAFTGAYGGDSLDAANLLIAHTGFLPASDPRYLATLKATEEHLVINDLCFRYRSADDFGMPESTFSICTFWYIDALRLTGQLEKARDVFERMLSRSNHLGLFSEGIHPLSGTLTGNFPQAYTHVAIINSGMLLSRPWGDVGSRHYGDTGEGEEAE